MSSGKIPESTLRLMAAGMSIAREEAAVKAASKAMAETMVEANFKLKLGEDDTKPKIISKIKNVASEHGISVTIKTNLASFLCKAQITNFKLTGKIKAMAQASKDLQAWIDAQP